MIDKEKIKEAVTMLLEAIGEDTEREGLVETPDRVSRMYEEIFGGMEESPEAHLAKTFDAGGSEIVIEKDIQFYSMCEHHMMPFYGKVHIAYVPKGKVAGLSKLARTVEVFSRRLQIQERMTEEIADSLMKYLEPEGCMVYVEAEHMCMTMRGVKKPGTRTVTLATRGCFRDNDRLHSVFMNAIRD